MADEETAITAGDMDSLAAKFEAFSAELAPVERAALMGIMGAAEEGGDDSEVSGFKYGELGKVGNLERVPGSLKIGGGIKTPDPLEAVSVGVTAYCVSGEWSRD